VSRAVGGGGRERGFAAEKHGIVWHHHFSVPELRALLEPAFQVERIRRRGCLVAPICAGLAFPFYRRHAYDHPIAKLLHRLEAWDLSLETSARFAWNLLVVARKPASPESAAARVLRHARERAIDASTFAAPSSDRPT
jgi:hypothetical protein